jgi:hypothetical protein
MPLGWYDWPTMMEWKMEFRSDLNALCIKTRGVLTAESANEMIREIVSMMAHHRCNNQIVDHRDTVLNLSVSEYYRRPNINEEIGISRSWKVAMIFRELNDDTHFMENVFRNRGYNLREFADMNEAEAWILEE